MSILLVVLHTFLRHRRFLEIFRMAEGDTAASVGWQGVVRSPLLRAGTVQVVVASPWTPHREVRLETHRSSILAGFVLLLQGFSLRPGCCRQCWRWFP